MLEDYHGDNEEDEDGEENEDVHYKEPSQEGEVGQHWTALVPCKIQTRIVKAPFHIYG